MENRQQKHHYYCANDKSAIYQICTATPSPRCEQCGGVMTYGIWRDMGDADVEKQILIVLN